MCTICIYLQSFFHKLNSKESETLLYMATLQAKTIDTLDIVIAHYKEDLSWVKHLPRGKIPLRYIHLYHKHLPTTPFTTIPMPALREYSLPNVGREGHTYLTYIYEHYNHLPDTVIFLQGNPFDHIGCKPTWYGIQELLHNWLYNIQHTGFTPNYTYTQTYYPSSKWTLSSHEMKTYGITTPPLIKTMNQFFRIYQDRSYPERCLYWYPGACFGVQKRFILSRPRDYYRNLQKALEYAVSPLEGHFVERMWMYIFNPELKHVTKIEPRGKQLSPESNTDMTSSYTYVEVEAYYRHKG